MFESSSISNKDRVRLSGHSETSHIKIPRPVVLVGTIVYDDGSAEQITIKAQDEKGLNIQVENGVVRTSKF